MNKKGVFRIFSLVLVIAMLLQVMPAAFDLKVDVQAAGKILTAQEVMKEMGVGWNLGNSLDSHENGYYSSNITDYETQWSNPVVTKQLITAVKNKGFNTIRIPTTWYQHITKSTDSSGKTVYTIDTKWLGRVKEVVDYAISNNMYVILNVHHENWIDRSDFGSAYAAMSEELKQVWKQIATYFASYDQHLIFEGMNEPRAKGASDEWWTTDNAKFETINKLNADFVNTVRSVASSYKDTRVLMVPGYAASGDVEIYKPLAVPNDAYVAVSIHAYKPYDFCMGGGDHSTWSAAYKSQLKTIFANIDSTFISKGIPVVIGEFSASNFNNDTAREAWATDYMTFAKKLGIPCVLWDNNSGDSGYSECHRYINRTDLTWDSSGVKVVNALINVYNDASVEWKGTSTPSTGECKHNDYATGTSINVNGEFIDAAAAYINSSYEIAVKYNGAEPTLAFMSAGYGDWTTVGAYDIDEVNRIAYFKCADIKESWTCGKAIAYIKVVDAGSNFAGIVLSSASALDEPKVEEKPVTPSVDTSKDGLFLEEGKWCYYNKGIFANDYTGLVHNAEFFWYVVNGVVDTEFKGFYTNAAGKWYVAGGKVDVNFTGLGLDSDGTWVPVFGGKAYPTYTGLVQNAGYFWYCKDGKVDTSYTGFYTNDAGKWYVTTGKIDTTFVGLGKEGDKWLAVFNGKAYPEYTGLVQNAGYYWYIKNGTLDTTYTGIVENAGKNWYVINGKMQYQVK